MGTSGCVNGAREAFDAVAGKASIDAANDVGGSCAWERAHRALSRLGRQRAALDAEEGRCLLAALRSAAHVHLGFGTFAEYVERVLGYSPRSTHEKLRVAEALEGLPLLSRALDEGALSWSALRELTRVASTGTEQEWLEFASGKTVRQLEEVVASVRPGDGPDSPRAPAARRHILRFEVAPETLALFREASAHLRRNADAAFDDDATLLAMARAVLGGPSDEGRASYQVSLSLCSECGHAEQRANGALIAVGPEIVAMASCDAQHLGTVATPANDTPSSADLEPYNLARPMAPADEPKAVVPGVTEAQAPSPVRAHVHARANQTIPPAVRRAVLQRDQHRCCVPGCRNATFLDLHHIVPRSQGGPNDAENLCTLCGAHHRAAHRGDLIIERHSGALRFRHADGRPYGEVSPLTSLAVESKVASALRGLGFRGADIGAVLAEVRELSTREGAPCITTTEGLLREALVRLGPGRRAR
jgi:hypothetical protein